MECGSVAYRSDLYGDPIPIFHTMKTKSEQGKIPEGHDVLELPSQGMHPPEDTIQTPFLSSQSLSSKMIAVEGGVGG